MTNDSSPIVSLSDERLDEMLAGLEGVTPGPWRYRPEQFDDWGFVRAPTPDSLPGDLVCVAKYSIDLEEADLDAHRRNRTDPVRHLGEHIARCDPDTMRSILTELKALRASHADAGGEVAVTEAGPEVSLADCPVGLFRKDGEVCLKTEYGNNEGRIDAYIVSSGEFFWGDAPQTIANQRRQMVQPLTLTPTEPAVRSGEPVAWTNNMGLEFLERGYGIDVSAEAGLMGRNVPLYVAPVAPRVSGVVDDVADPLKTLSDNCWDMRCVSSPIADTGDADVEWVVIEHHMARPQERVVGRGSTPRAALLAALEPNNG